MITVQRRPPWGCPRVCLTGPQPTTNVRSIGVSNQFVWMTLHACLLFKLVIFHSVALWWPDRGLGNTWAIFGLFIPCQWQPPPDRKHPCWSSRLALGAHHCPSAVPMLEPQTPLLFGSMPMIGGCSSDLIRCAAATMIKQSMWKKTKHSASWWFWQSNIPMLIDGFNPNDSWNISVNQASQMTRTNV